MISSLVVRAALVAAVVAATAPAAQAFQIRGIYSSSEGQVNLWHGDRTGQWFGEYGDDGGRIEAFQSEPDAISGYWMENSSDVRCDTERGGTYYWGRMNFVWEPSMPLPPGAFAGRWSYCDTRQNSKDWIGIRQPEKG